MKPRLLDLFCGAGGCTRGYQEAGFEVVGVDLNPMPSYCGEEFVQANALDILRYLLADQGQLSEFAAIHASPPCQAYSPLNAYNRKDYPDLVDPIRDLLIATGLPYVIENVPQAPLRDPVTLCGSMFGLRLYRHRGFETNWPMVEPKHPHHVERCTRNGYLPTDEAPFMSIHGGKHSKAWQQKAAEYMGVPWMRTIPEVCEAIPPAFTRHIGAYLLQHIADQSRAAA